VVLQRAWMLLGMSAHEQSFLGVTRKPRSSRTLLAPVTAAVRTVKLGLARLLALAGGLNPWACRGRAAALVGTQESRS
jgi:hypothetical protein